MTPLKKTTIDALGKLDAVIKYREKYRAEYELEVQLISIMMIVEEVADDLGDALGFSKEQRML